MTQTKGVAITGAALAFSNRKRRAGVHSKVRQHDKEDQQMFSIATTAFSMPATSSIIAKTLPPKVVALQNPNRCAMYYSTRTPCDISANRSYWYRHKHVLIHLTKHA